MRRLIAIVLSGCLVSQAALAAPAMTTSNVNFRQGPGTNYGSNGTLSGGTKLDLQNCDDSGAWCSVVVNGQTGFVSGQYLELSEAEKATGWPRSFKTDGGATLVLYQPQFSEWQDFKVLKALVAAEYIKDDKAKPVFGVIGVSGSTVADGKDNDVIVRDIKITQIDFSALDRTALTDLTLQVGKIMPTGSITVKEDRITAGLAEHQRMDDVAGLNAEAPTIFVRTVPSILVQTDGEPILAPVKGVQGLSFVVNSNWDVLKLDEGETYYLRDEKSWLTSSDPAGKWEPVTELPKLIQSLPDDENWSETREGIPAQAFPDTGPPEVVYSDKPAEMILFEGEPKLEAVDGTKLEWASNTDSDVFYLKETSTWYILVSGRWFKSASLEGPWVFTTPDLPADFLNIPEDAPYYSVRASVPGTSEADQARLKASIPSTARVELGSVSADVAYAGDPEFTPIDGTSLSYAVNTNDQVIKVGDQYYVLQNGVWFVGDSPDGPFQVATAVPDEIYTIPPSSPVYNVTYVRVYDSEPNAVWYGYTMGYLAGYLSWGVFVYGTGWYHNPWYRPGLRPIYFPRPVTYGIGAFYNPIRGTYGRYGYAYGPRRGIAGGGVYNPRTGGYIRGGAVSGPRGSAGFIAAYNPRTGNKAVIAGGRNIYGSWTGGGVTRGSEWARTADLSANAQKRWKADGQGGNISSLDRRGDVFAGRDGSVYRRNGDDWQKFEGGKWAGVDRPSRDQIRDNAGNLGAAAALGGAGAALGGAAVANRPAGSRPEAKRPSGKRPTQAQRPAQKTPARTQAAKKRPAQRPATRPATRPQAPAHLNRDSRTRQAGNRNVNRQRNVQRTRSQSRPQRSGGGNRGGGHRGGGRRR
ncbi:SH3 domain-containing protein [Roseibium algae]|uniref:SH3 domain-containing protein n=1 Tax=Roseibium algae TaxID=3123038 RepID=A0ABU8TKW6_9HYPH